MAGHRRGQLPMHIMARDSRGRQKGELALLSQSLPSVQQAITSSRPRSANGTDGGFGARGRGYAAGHNTRSRPWPGRHIAAMSASMFGARPTVRAEMSTRMCEPKFLARHKRAAILVIRKQTRHTSRMRAWPNSSIAVRCERASPPPPFTSDHSVSMEEVPRHP